MDHTHPDDNYAVTEGTDPIPAIVRPTGDGGRVDTEQGCDLGRGQQLPLPSSDSLADYRRDAIDLRMRPPS